MKVGVNIMMKLRKIWALVLAVAMIALVGAAFASTNEADMEGESGVIGEFQAADTPDAAYTNYVLLYKEITAFNASGEDVCAPTIDYEYTIAPGTAGASVKDAGGTSLHATGSAVEVQVKAGPTGATISGSADGGTTYVAGKLQLSPSIDLDTSSAGTKNAFPLKVDLSGVTWTGAGVYRYVITETTTEATKNAAGIADGTITSTRYLDVYVKDKTGGGYEVYGYVCFSNLDAIDGTDTDSVTAAGKTEGFVATTGTDAQTADQYYTFDLTISKTLVGDAAQNAHKFPFSVDFTNASVTAVIGLKQTTVEGGGITATLPTAAAVSGLDVSTTNLKLANGASVTYVGIPVGITDPTTVKVYEENDVTGTIYTSSYTIDSGTASTAKSLTWSTPNNKSDEAELTTITENVTTNTAHTIAFTNTLELISPTGYVARFAPYALMLIGGIALLIVAKKHRRHAEEEDK